MIRSIWNTLCLLALLFFAGYGMTSCISEARAAEPKVTAIAVSIASHHFDREVKHNEVNPGVFVELNHAYVLGVYRNSNYRTTVLAARQFHLVSWGSVNVGAMAGVCTGYDFALPVCAAATVEYRGLTLAVIPPVSSSGGVVGLSYRLPIKP